LEILVPNQGFGNVARRRRLTYADPDMRNLVLALLHLAVVTHRGAVTGADLCCSTPPFMGRAGRDISVRITIRCSRHTGGGRT
jgi:hypothetical protein